jgi:lipopolysaccharide export system protein LptA
MPARPFALVLALLPGLAAAQEFALGGLTADPALPIEVEAETLTVDQATGSAVFAGGVTIGQGELRIAAAEVELRYDEATGAIVRLLARGGVTFATPTEAAEAREADYDLGAQTLTLSGDVLLSQGGAAISADRLVIDLAAGTARAEGRVRTVLRQDAGEAAP